MGMEGARVPVDLEAIIGSVSRMIKETFPKNIALVVRLGADRPVVVGDPTQVEQVLLNLSVNARDAMPYGGELRISVSTVILDSQFVGATPGA